MRVLLLLAIIPLVQFCLLYVVSHYRKSLDLLSDLYAINYLDWLFVPVNVLLVYTVAMNWTVAAIAFGISLVALAYLHVRWHAIGKKQPKAYFTDANGLTPEGWIHFVFMAIQAPLSIGALFSLATSPWYLGLLACLLAYFLSYMFIIKYVREVALRSKAEYPFILLGIGVVLVRGVVYLCVGH